jgi:hypothetical protein
MKKFIGSFSRSIIRCGVALAICASATLHATHVMAATSTLLFNPTSNTNNNVNGTIGYKFAGASSPSTSTIKGLGFVDAGGDGLAASHQVGLYHWNGSAYSLERSVTIGTGTSFYSNSGYRWYPIADLILSDTTADAYFLGATVSSGDGDSWGGNGSATFTSVGNSTLNAGYNATAGSLSSSVLPSTWDGSFPGNTFYNAPNAITTPVPIPEPSTCAIALAGLACGGYSMFRRRRDR